MSEQNGDGFVLYEATSQRREYPLGGTAKIYYRPVSTEEQTAILDRFMRRGKVDAQYTQRLLRAAVLGWTGIVDKTGGSPVIPATHDPDAGPPPSAVVSRLIGLLPPATTDELWQRVREAEDRLEAEREDVLGN